MNLCLEQYWSLIIPAVDARLAVFYTILKIVLDLADIILHDSFDYVKGELALLHALRCFFERNSIVKIR